MKTTKVFLTAVIIFLGVILSDGNAKPLNSSNDNSERPRRRVVLVKRHSFVRPVIYVAPRHHRYHHRRIVFIH